MSKLLTILIAAVLLFSQTASPAFAQDDPRQILQDSATALQSTPGFSAKVTLSGDGSQMILATLPSMTARFTLGNHPEYGNAIHLIGELRAQTTAPPETFDIVYTKDKLIWADHPKQTINHRLPSVSVRIKPAPFKYLLLAELISDAPYQTELDNAQSIELQPQQSIAGENCNVIYITRSKAASGSKRSGVGAHTMERWFISVDDNLPRRVEQITDAGMIKATLIMELSGLSVGQQSDADLEVFAPESYKVSDTTRPRTPPTTTNKPTLPDQDQPFTKPTQSNTPALPTNPLAPNYSFTDTASTTISRDTQAGRVTVLYFFGSWSIPSKQTTPLLSTLARDFNTQTAPDAQVDTFAIALRESDPDAAEEDHTDNAYAHRLAINPDSNLPALFKVRVYPTIIVIDDNNRIIFKQHLTKDSDPKTPEQLIDNAKSAITKAIVP